MSRTSTRQCSICLQSLPPDSQKQLDLCKHSFHPACIRDWSFVVEKCPMCRQPLSQRQIQTFGQQWPAQKREEKNTNRLFELLHAEIPDLSKIMSFAMKHATSIGWQRKDTSGLYISDYAIMLSEPELFRLALTHGHDFLAANGDGLNTLQVLNEVIKNSNRLPEIVTAQIKITQGLPLSHEEEEYVDQLLQLKDVRQIMLEFYQRRFPRHPPPKIRSIKQMNK